MQKTKLVDHLKGGIFVQGTKELLSLQFKQFSLTTHYKPCLTNPS